MTRAQDIKNGPVAELNIPLKTSFPRKRESSLFQHFWIPAFAGMTYLYRSATSPNSLFRGVIVGVACLLMASPAPALPPLEMLYCGNVTDNDGRPFRSGQFLFRIVDETGTLYWTSSSVTPSFSSNGDFCITLGRDTERLTASIFSGDEPLFLEISFRGGGYSTFETFSPSTPLVYAPFAAASANADSDSETTSGSSDSMVITGEEGITVEKGDVTLTEGDLIVSVGDIEATTGTVSASEFSAITAYLSGNLTVDTSTLAVDSANDRVGIGTASPQTGLDISKDVRITPTTSTGSGVLIDGASVTSGVVFDIDAQASLTTGGSALRIKYDSSKFGSSNNVIVVRDVAGSGSNVFTLDGAGNLTAAGNLTLTDGSVSESKLGTSAVTTNKIIDSGITTGKIANSAVTSAKITDGTIATADLADNAITSTKIENLSVSNAKLAQLSVGTSKIQDDAITTAKIADGTITSDDILDGTIVNADISTTAVIATSKLSGAVTSIASHGLGTLATASAVGSAEITDASIAT
ncbi:MAG: hypothetical protein HY538_04090, partial [Deltaproteobacteria bacterium]|nr:hypothetical protein [Deltaproteobacteria bacterium]